MLGCIVSFAPLWFLVPTTAGQKRDWQVPGMAAAKVGGVQFSEEPVIPCRRVGFRTKESALDTLGSLTIYPVVRTPSGQIYRGFSRRYAKGAVGVRWLFWTFPTQFRALGSKVEREDAADYGDSLADTLEGNASKALPAGEYQVKWVINGKLVDTGDAFNYVYKAIPAATKP